MIKLALAGSVVIALGASVSAELTQGGVDRLTLTDGRVVEAPILKESAETVWLDLGFEVIAVPRADIAELVRAVQPTSAESISSGMLYSISDTPLPERAPRDLADELGEAIIKVSTPSGLGSGFIIHPDGFAITNAHVIQGETNIKATVFHQSEQEFKRSIIEDVEIIAVNDGVDLALIKLEHPDGEPFPIVYVEGGDALEVGEEVFAIGNPLGLERTLSTGTVSTTNRAFWGLAFVQTTAEINPGNSGGPLFNLKGEVVGCTNMGALFADGIGFAIPARYIRDFIQNHEAFAYDKDNPNAGIMYNDPPQRLEFAAPASLADD
ncbi:MAG: trypsin-like peptidase domain-containing protein [Planctomycetota bacterium]